MNIEVLRNKFNAWYGRSSVAPRVYFAPGRVCLLGEHIDYNGGLVLPATISMGIYAVARPLDHPILWLKSSIDPREKVVSLHTHLFFDKKHDWANYPIGMAKYFIEKGYAIKGCEILYHSTLPAGAGLSSSAAIEVLTGYLLADLNQIAISPTELAWAAKEVENHFVGVPCGIMDQFAIVFGRENMAIQLQCFSLEYELLPFRLNGHQLIIFNTQKPRKLAESVFHKRVAECQEAYRQIALHENISCLAEASPKMIDTYLTDRVLKKRALHVTSENKRVGAASKALANNDLAQLGQLLFDSHYSLQHNYEVTGHELDTFVEFAARFPGCKGAKMTGAGFGGCALAIVENQQVDSFIYEAERYYQNKTCLTGVSYRVQVVDGVRGLDEDQPMPII